MNDLGAVIAALAVGVTSASNAQGAAFGRYKQRLNRLNVGAGSVVASGVVSSAVGTQFDVPIQFIPGTSQVAGLQFDLVLPTGFTLVSVARGPVATVASKDVSANLPNGRILLAGLNQNVLGEGHLLTVRLSTQASVLKRRYSLGIKEILASNPQGNDVVLSGMVAPVTIQ